MPEPKYTLDEARILESAMTFATKMEMMSDDDLRAAAGHLMNISDAEESDTFHIDYVADLMLSVCNNRRERKPRAPAGQLLARLLEDTYLQGTGLMLFKNSLVFALPATNQPEMGKFFISPAHGIWPHIGKNDSSILVGPDEISFDV